MPALSMEQRDIFEQTQVRLLDWLLYALALAYIPGLLLILLRIQHEGVLPVHVGHIVNYGLSLLMLLYGKRFLPYLWRASLVLGMWWASTSLTLITVGPVSEAKAIFVIIVMLATFLLPHRVGIAAVLLVMLSVGGVGVAVVYGGWAFPVDYQRRMQQPMSWAFSAYNIGIIAGIAAYTVWLMVDTLRRTLRQSQQHARELDQALQRQRAIFASSNAAMGVVKERTLIEANDYLAGLLGYRREELLGQPTRRLHVDHQHYEDFVQLIEEPLRSGSSNLEYPFRHRDGHRVWVYLSLTALEDEIVLVGIDISELRRAREAAEAASRAKTRFLANMSHELRTPLNSVSGFAQLLAAAPNLEASQREYAQVIRQGAGHLLVLINELLDLARIEDGRMELQPVSWAPDELFHDVLRLLRQRAAEKGIQLLFISHGALPAALCSDERYLRQILLNLLGNAIKFTDQGWVRLSAGYADGRLRIEVADSGIGIDPAELPLIFERFHQAGPEQRKGQGSGLGLSISRRLVELLGGELHAASSPGAGSLFSFELPIPLASSPEAAPVRSDMAAGFQVQARPGSRPVEVLVVDDVAVNRLLLSALLTPQGFVVSEAEDGASCLARVAQQAPQLVLLDLHLPDMDGLEIARRLRAQGYRGALVMVSASAFESDQIASLQAGCDDFMPKPIDLVALGRRLQKLGLAEPLPPAQ